MHSPVLALPYGSAAQFPLLLRVPGQADYRPRPIHCGVDLECPSSLPG